MKTQKKTYIDLFAGCGGLSLGLYNSGQWKGLFAIEKSADAFQTLKHNLIKNKKHFCWPTWLPQTQHDINDILKRYSAELKSLKNHVDLVVGGPPCQGFSTAGRRIESADRHKLINSYISFVRLVQPKVIFFENVKGFTQQFDKNKVRGRIYSEYVKKELDRSSKSKDFIGYDVYGELVDFSEFGIPQKRTRFILVGVRKDYAERVNPKVFFDALRLNKELFFASKNLNISTTLEEAISDLLKSNGQIETLNFKMFKSGVYSNISSPYQKHMRLEINGNSKPDSHRFVNHNKETENKFEYILQNAEKNKPLSEALKKELGIKKHTIIPLSGTTPTPTITTLPDDYIHYCEPRIFTVREYARIQSFPDWYEFKGKYTTGGKLRTKEVPRYSQVGNAIPPLFGEQVGIVLNHMID